MICRPPQNAIWFFMGWMLRFSQNGLPAPTRFVLKWPYCIAIPYCESYADPPNAMNSFELPNSCCDQHFAWPAQASRTKSAWTRIGNRKYQQKSLRAKSEPLHSAGLQANITLISWATLQVFLFFCGCLVIPWPFLGSGGVWKWSWAIGLRPVLIWAPTEPYGPISDQISYFLGQEKSDPGHKFEIFPKMSISSSSHSYKYLTYMGR